MKKFIWLVAFTFMVFFFIPKDNLAQNSNEAYKLIDGEKAYSMIDRFAKRYTKFLHKAPTAYMAKFSKKDLINLIESEEAADSVNLVFGIFLKDEADSIRKNPTIVFQFHTVSTNPTLPDKYIYKAAPDICPPPKGGCLVPKE